MALIEEFEKNGKWLFRWRSYLPLMLIGFSLIAMRNYEYLGYSEVFDHLWEAFCLIISFFGLGIRIFTIGHVPKGTSGRNTKKQIADSLNTTGMYSVVRNPLYLGNFFMGLGIALFTHIWWLMIIYILVFWVYYERIIFAEEVYLRIKFGNEFLNWAAVTPAIFPKFSNYRKPNLPFSFKTVLRREYNGFFAVIIVMFVFEIVGDMIINVPFHIDVGWFVLLSIGFIVWLTLRTLKKHTTVLNVQGRY